MRNEYRIVAVAVALLAAAATAVAAQAVDTPAKSSGTEPPRGPHFILTVPLEFYSLPPEIDQYSVTCQAWSGVPNATGTRYMVTTGPNVQAEVGIVGKGTASGPIPGPDSHGTHDFKSSATVGIFIDFPPGRGAGGTSGAEGIARRLALATWYRCEMSLTGTAYQVTTTYVDATVSIPRAKGAAYAQFVQGQLPQ